MEPSQAAELVPKDTEIDTQCKQEKAPLGSATSEDVDGAKGKHKSKKHKRKRGKKQRTSERGFENDSGARKTGDETGGDNEGRPSAVRKTGPSSAEGVKSNQSGTSSTPKRDKPSGSGTPNRPRGTPNTPGGTPNTPKGHGQHTSSLNHHTPASNNHTPSKQESGGRGPHSSRKKKHKKKKIFEEYWTKEQVSASLKRHEIYQGVLRISPKNYEMAWISLKDFKRDVAVVGMMSRNRALNGDVVAIQILPQEKWSVMAKEMKYDEKPMEDVAKQLLELKMSSDEDESHSSEKSVDRPKSPKKGAHIEISEVPEKYLQRTAKVVYIIEKKHSRVACGYLRPMTDPNDKDGLFSPADNRLPRLRIPHDACPPGFFERPQDFQTTLLIARLTEWSQEAPRDSYFAQGCFARSLGEAGEIEPETDGILMVNDIDCSSFSENVLACLPKDLPWKVPQEEVDARRDFREVCVFTIDPATARDLDDALHCTRLDDGTFEVGVHIADVSFFVKEGTQLDEVASDRATSTYMVQKVIPMLPRLLCEELCSLNPGEDRLTFSVVWKMDKNGIIQDEWMGKGIIRSRVKLSYQHAQEMIDHPEKSWKEEEHPPLSGGATISDIVERVRALNRIAVNLRRKRFENGTLRLNKAKISFDLDGKTGLPIGWHPYVQRESNQLIEEYMLLANMAVAHRIYNAYPETALLRCHPKPDSRQLEEIRALCSSLQINFAHESSKGIQESLNTFSPNSPEHLVLSQLAMKPMKAAKYFSAGSAESDPDQFLHYALSVPLYTHFTSPIRRYPDVIVHRLLAASLKVGPVPEFAADDLENIASHCNDKKFAAKRAGEASLDLYLGAFIRECGPLTEDGIVAAVMHESVDILVPSFGIIKRVYFKYCEQVKSFEFEERDKSRPAKVLVTWKVPDDKNSKEKRPHTYTLTVFSYVRILLVTESDKKKNKGGLRYSGELLPCSAEKEK